MLPEVPTIPPLQKYKMLHMYQSITNIPVETVISYRSSTRTGWAHLRLVDGDGDDDDDPDCWSCNSNIH